MTIDLDCVQLKSPLRGDDRPLSPLAGTTLFAPSLFSFTSSTSPVSSAVFPELFWVKHVKLRCHDEKPRTGLVRSRPDLATAAKNAAPVVSDAILKSPSAHVAMRKAFHAPRTWS